MPVNVFGGGPIQTADVSYKQYDINSTNSPYQLNWPSSYKDTNQLVTKIIDVSVQADNIFAAAKVLSATNLDALYDNGTAGEGATLKVDLMEVLIIDDVTLAVNDRVLVIGQATLYENGIYTLTQQGSASDFPILTRSSDYDQPDEISEGDLISVSKGTIYGESSWEQTTPGPFVIGTTAITWEETSNIGIILPKANEVSVGMSFIIRNIGDSGFDLLNSNKVKIGYVDINIQYYYFLTDNSTAAGVWENVVFGAGTSSADAGVLAGNGLVALTGALNTNIEVTPISTTPYNIMARDRANLLVWKTGSGIVNLPATGDLPSGFYFSFNNEGTGTATITPPPTPTPPPIVPSVTIDSSTEGLVVAPGQSLSCIYDGTNWFSLGLGAQTLSLFSVLTLGVSSGTITLNPAQASNNIQIYTGTLTGPVNILFPAGLINQWTIYNKTTGAFTLTIKFNGTPSNSYIIPQGGEQVFFSDGTNLYQSINYVSLINGSSTLPSLAFKSAAGAYDTGLLSDGAGTIYVTSNGTEVMSMEYSGTTGSVSFPSPNTTLNLSNTGNMIKLPMSATATPSLAFPGTTGTYNTGLTSAGSGDGSLLISSNGIEVMSIEYSGTSGIISVPQTGVTLDMSKVGNRIKLPEGSVIAPSLAFLGATSAYNTGILSDGTGSAGGTVYVTSNGTTVMGMEYSGTTGLVSFPSANTTLDLSNTGNRILLSNGSAPLPSLNFLGGGSTSSSGFRSDTSGNIYLSNTASGTSVDLIRFGTAITPSITFLTSGSATIPSLRFLGTGSIDGIYSTTAGHVSIGVNSALVADFTSTAINISQPISPSSPAIRASTFDALSPTASTGDMIYRTSNLPGGTNVPLTIGSPGKALVASTSAIPSFTGLSIMQFKSVTSSTITTVTNTTLTTISGLTTGLTPTAPQPTSKIFIMVDISVGWNTANANVISFQLIRTVSGTSTAIPTAATPIAQVEGPTAAALSSAAASAKVSFSYLDPLIGIPTNSAITYSISFQQTQAVSCSINQLQTGTGTATSSSTITAIEISGTP